MGYPTIKRFDINFLKRTLENLEYRVPNTFTHLVNSLSGLILLPNQWNIQGRRNLEYLEKSVNEFSELDFLKESTYYTDENNKEVPIKKLEFKHGDINNLTIESLLKRMRNAIAHQAIRPTKEGENWHGIIFRGYSSDKKTSRWEDNYDLQVYLSKSEIEKLARFIANKYLLETTNITDNN